MITFHHPDSLVDVLPVLALNEMPTVIECQVLCQGTICFVLTVGLLVLLGGKDELLSTWVLLTSLLAI